FPKERARDMLVVPDLPPGAFDHRAPQIERATISPIADVPHIGVLGVEHRPLAAPVGVLLGLMDLLRRRIMGIIEFDMFTAVVGMLTGNRARAGGIEFAGDFCRQRIIAAWVVFVAHTPNDDTRMVLVARNGFPRALLEGRGQLRVIAIDPAE